ncbi:hypothetical protein ABVK25_005962 [Lepraria finkii]|uniref:Uncharacterized protein n=1 Tax=Lepraria finkii TaxID=1340010 RepID=A0ABR4B896_9LECA
MAETSAAMVEYDIEYGDYVAEGIDDTLNNSQNARLSHVSAFPTVDRHSRLSECNQQTSSCGRRKCMISMWNWAAVLSAVDSHIGLTEATSAESRTTLNPVLRKGKD